MRTWTLAYDGFDPKKESLREALCTTGNGYFCTRGGAEWADADESVHYPGTYLAGGYNRLVTRVADRPVENEDLVNMPNWLCLTFRIDGGDWLDLSKVEVLSYRQELNTLEGVLLRRLRVRDAQKRETTLESRRFVHMGKPHLAAIEWRLTPENWEGKLEVRSALDGRVINYGVKRYRQLNSRHLEPVKSGTFGEDGIFVLVQTNQSRIQVGEAARTRLFQGDQPVQAETATQTEAGYAAQSLVFSAAQGQESRIEKVVALYSSRDRAISEPATEACDVAARAPGFEDLLRTHRLAWDLLWRRCYVDFAGCESFLEDGAPAPEKPPEAPHTAHERMQMIVRLHIFQLLQTVSPHAIDLDVGVPARGLHGEAYRGHIFWDELFIFPFLTVRLPHIVQALLLYRSRRLDKARALAAEEGFRGAMFPWQSGSDGREETQIVHLNPESGHWIPDMSHNQRHVNLAIAYNIWQYFQSTRDWSFMSNYGAVMLLAIARFFASKAVYNPERDRYEIHGVMGPDEYHEAYPGSEEHGLRNNAYTNIMVSWLLEKALQVLEGLFEYRTKEVRQILDLQDEEIALWTEISHKLYVPFLDGDIISQFEGYEKLQEFDWEGYRKKYGDIQRLDRILEAEGDTPNRYKLSKQADVLMLFYLFSARELRQIFERLDYPFDAKKTIARTIEYYASRTSHGSTLSNIVHAAVTARYDKTQSWKMFCKALESDVGDIQGGATSEGIHLGAMAGTVDLLQRLYMGMEVREDALYFDPQLPDQLEGLAFGVRFRNMWMDVSLTAGKLKIGARAGGPEVVKVGVRDRVYLLRAGYSREFKV